MKFSQELNCDENSFFKILTDYSNLPKYLPKQLHKIEVLEEQDQSVIIQLTIFFKTLIKKSITQKIRITTESKNHILCEILDGHAKGTSIIIFSSIKDDNMEINIETDLKLSLKAKILSPIIKREYTPLLYGLINKITMDANEILKVNNNDS